MNTNKREEDKKIVDGIKLQNNNDKIYENKVAELNDTYTQLIKDYSKYYDMTMNDPSNAEYKQMYLNIKANIQNIFYYLFTLSNTIYDENNDILKNTSKIEEIINNEKTMGKKLKNGMNNSSENKRSSEILKNDFIKINYQEIYILVSLIFSIFLLVIIGIIINKYYTNST